jgi:hypothetical protein
MSTITGNNRNLQVLRGLQGSMFTASLLSCSQDGTIVNLFNTDDGSGRQRWNITLVAGFTDVYNIKVSTGTNTDRVYLSCSADGTRVDLWDTDDGIGRQRWQFVPLSSNIPSYFHIKVVGGVSGGRVFLSCAANGPSVDLWNTDDGSGRQRWQLQ